MRGLLKVAELAALAGVLTGGYLLLHSKASAVPAVASPPREIARTAATPMASPAAPPVARQASPPAIAAARAPVPLQVGRRDTYWVGDPQASATAPAGAAVPEQADKAASDARAKAMIEADGYKNARVLSRAPDGTWRGVAMRGSVEVAVSVDENGTVSTQ